MVLNCSDVTAADIDTEVMKILSDSYEEAKRLLSAHRNTLDEIAEFLIEKETITGKEFMEIFRRVEGISEDEVKSTGGRIHEKNDPADSEMNPAASEDTLKQGEVFAQPVREQEEAPAQAEAEQEEVSAQEAAEQEEVSAQAEAEQEEQPEA